MQKKRSLAIMVGAVVLAAMTGCASLPSLEQMKAETATYQLPKLPDAGKAMVYVVRPSAMGTLVRFNVFVDDQEAVSEMGYNRGNQYIYFQVPPGEHKIFSKAENWADATISAAAGDVVFIQQEAKMGIIMARNDITKIDEIPGKYHVKKLDVGTIIKTEK